MNDGIASLDEYRRKRFEEGLRERCISKMRSRARTLLDAYRQQIAASHGEYQIFDHVELSQDEMAVILQIHDYGLDGITEEETQLLYSVIAEIKNHIHP